MSSTNKTANYDLTQFIGTDKPAWLVDYNGDMVKIDTAIKNAADAASAAQTTANGADSKVDSTITDVSALSGTVTSLASSVTAVTGNVNTINSLIGNGEPTTTDKTLIGAINELNADKLDISDLVASKVPINSIAGVTADDVQEALEAINEKASTGLGDFTLAGSETGTSAISIPATAKEIVVYCKYSQSGSVSFNALKVAGDAQLSTGFYTGSGGVRVTIDYSATNNTVELFRALSDGADVASTTVTTVYYR